MPRYKMTFSAELIQDAPTPEEALGIFAKHIYELATQENSDKEFDLKIEELRAINELTQEVFPGDLNIAPG